MSYHKFRNIVFPFTLLFVLFFSGSSLLLSAEYTVNTESGLKDALDGIEAGDDADNTIVIASNFLVSDTDIFDDIHKNKRIFIKFENGSTLHFNQGINLPQNVNLVIDSPNTDETSHFIIDGNGTIIDGGMELRDTLMDVQNGLYLGVDASSNASLVLNGPWTWLDVEGKDTPTDIDGTASLLVNNRAMLSIDPDGEVKFNGQATFDNGILDLESDTSNQSLFSTGTNGWIRFENKSILHGSGKLEAKNGVHVNSGSMIWLDETDDKLNIDGGLWLDSTSTVRVLAGNTNDDNGKIVVENGPAAIQGTFILDLKPEYYGTTPLTYTILTRTGGYSGDFDEYRLTQDRYGIISNVSSNDNLIVQFKPYVDPHARITRTWNEWNVGNALDNIYRSSNPAWGDFFTDVMGMNDTQALQLFNQLSGEIYADMLMSVPSTHMSQFAMNRVSWDSQHGHVFFGPQYRLAANSNNRSVWAQFLYDHNKVDPDGNAAGYKMDRYGVVGGVDQTLVGGKTAIGVILGYSNPELKRHGDKAKADDYMIGIYGATRVFEAIEMKLWGGVGKQYYDVSRHAYGKRLSSSPEGTNVTTSAEIAVPLYNGGPLVIKPLIGYDYQHSKINGYTEAGDSLIALSGGKTSIKRHIGRIGLMGEFGGEYANVYGGAQYKHLLGGDKYATVGHQFVGGGPEFLIDGANLGKYSIMGNVGLQITLDDARTRMIFGDYTGDFGSKHTQHTGTIGFQQTF